MKFATINIWQKFGPWEERMPRLAEAIGALQADVIGLQEVRVEPDYDQGAILAKANDYAYVFGAGYDDNDGLTGNAIFSRFPVKRSHTERLPAGHRIQGRCLVFAELETPLGTLPFFTTHLNWELDDGESREAQVRAIAQVVPELAKGCSLPAVLTGDFNAEPDSDEMRYLRGQTSILGPRVYYADAWIYAGDGGPGVTYSKTNPFGALFREAERRIDYIYVREPNRSCGEPIEARVCMTETIRGMHPTDHYGVLATVRMSL
ncbi:MAG: endonuclease/exonuclease/phosphatase family protein [Polyangiaceae bacterium]